MPIWPFKRKTVERLDPLSLQQKLIESASSSEGVLLEFCKTFRLQLIENIDFLIKAPQTDSNQSITVEQYIPCLLAVAKCLSSKCGSPELWNRLTNNQDNPINRLQQWYSDMQARMQQLDYSQLISEGQEYIQVLQTAKGTGVRLNQAYVYGRMGQLHFHSGRVADSEQFFQSAYDICVELFDTDGQIAHLNNLLETRRYLGHESAIATLVQLIELARSLKTNTRDLEKRLRLLKSGEPLCRMVGSWENKEYEVSEFGGLKGASSVSFNFVRNRLSLEMVKSLVQQGNALALSGQLADALDKYREACKIDPYDPDPVYQMGTCWMELGACEEALKAFSEVERLAPGWYRCRTDEWIAQSILNGESSIEAYRVLLILEDRGLEEAMALDIAQQSVEKFPDFAPFYLALGDCLRKAKNDLGALEAYRHGLTLVQEPDLESRLLCAIVLVLPNEDPERMELIHRILQMKGSLMANATIQFMLAVQ